VLGFEDGKVGSKRLDDDPESLLERLNVLDVEALVQLWQPPGAGFLDEVGISTVRQDFVGGTAMDCEETEHSCDARQFVEHSFKPVRFDVLEYVNTTYQFSRIRRAIVRKCGVVRKVLEVGGPQFVQPGPKSCLTCAVIGDGVNASDFHQSLDERGVMERSDPIVGIAMQLLLQSQIFGGNCGAHGCW